MFPIFTCSTFLHAQHLIPRCLSTQAPHRFCMMKPFRRPLSAIDSLVCLVVSQQNKKQNRHPLVKPRKTQTDCQCRKVTEFFLQKAWSQHRGRGTCVRGTCHMQYAVLPRNNLKICRMFHEVEPDTDQSYYEDRASPLGI